MPEQQPSNEDHERRQLLAALRAVKRGDFAVRLPLDQTGIAGEIAAAFNDVVELLEVSTQELERITRVVGKEGKITQRAALPGASGGWGARVDFVNSLIGNLVQPAVEVARVIGAVAKGDLSQRMALEMDGRPLEGEFLRIGKTVNTMVDQLSSFASEVTRVAREVGTEGKLGGQALVPGVAGTWKDLTDNVNSMAANLTAQVRNIAEVTTAVANGNLSKKITVDVKGEILELKNTVNTMVDQLGSFASEVTRVAREVGTEGKLGGQADVRDVSGTWRDLTDSVNSMAANLTGQVRNIAQVTTAVANGDLSKKITVDVKGEILELKDTINTMVDQLSSFASEVTRVAREVGTEGKLGGQAVVKGVAGTWKDLTDNVNSMAGNLTAQVRNIADVTTAVANGDLSKKITVRVRGEILKLKKTINTMVDQLSSFASEVTRVAREVGTEGRLGGQAVVKGVAGTWKDLTDNVNMMAANLTAQVRGIARVVTAVAKGDLKQRLALESKGEIAALASTINEMNDTLATFAEQVTTVAREVGVEGKLGGQARVPGAAGTWRDLTDNVNQLAANLTTQVRAIAEVATAVTKGDLTRSITVEARGEVAALKDNINEMIRNLKDTTRKNTEQDWLKTNLAKFTRMLQGQKDLIAVARLILSELAPVVSAQHGAFYFMDAADGTPVLKLMSSYAFRERKHLANAFALGEGLVGQSALEKERLVLTEVPDDYIKIGSGLGASKPRNIVVLPVLFEGEVKAVVELASFNRYNETHLTFLDQLAESIGIVLNTIAATMRTEALLKQSQSLAEELQVQQEELKESNARLEEQANSLRASEELLKKQQDELKQTNEELEEKARELTVQKAEVDIKNREIELARLAVQERAEQLALTSKYKSEFLANMSHELRTPLNSLLILAEMLATNPEGNLTPKQVECIQTIFTSGSDLQALINDILDMAKIESGTMAVDVGEVAFAELREYVERTFQPVAQKKKLAFTTELAAGLPKAIFTDARRLEQVLRNLLSNALKFTERGKVNLRIEAATSGWSADHEALGRADKVIAFVVSDTGIGIPADTLRIIFEPFQQADTGTSRKYGGTGLGLSISREIAGLLGGEIRVTSAVGKGSTFTLYLPQAYPFPEAPARRGRALRDGTPQPAGTPRDDTGPATATAPSVSDDRHTIQPGDRVLLIVENDPSFASILLGMARERGFKGVVALGGQAGLELARGVEPDAITLDIRLPDMDGWKVLEHLKHDLNTRHIPVNIISVEEAWQRGLKLGAIAYLQKPTSQQALTEALAKLQSFVERRTKNLLVVEADESHRNNVVELIGNGDVQTTSVSTGAQALAALQGGPFDCMVLDLFLPDMSGFELIHKIKRKPELRDLPILVYTGKELTREEETELNRLGEASIIKDVRSPERLLDETALFLHRVEADLPEVKQRILRQIHETDPVLANRKVLIVDDDLRNIFALTTILEYHQMEVVAAENGKDGIATLQKTPEIDIVLMDIMMPEMDGYETIRAVRRMGQFKSLPIIALTAKAMKSDREKCIEAGASDYIAKPVNAEQLISLLRVWLYR
jgi:CheY-like chemotaxis protein/signal transduction histidine kinase/HAMP domain-containing protein